MNKGQLYAVEDQFELVHERQDEQTKLLEKIVEQLDEMRRALNRIDARLKEMQDK